MKKQLFLLAAIFGMTAGLHAAEQRAPMITSESDLSDQDRDIVKEVRQTLINDPTLSKYAQSIRVTAQDGTVTLQGYVSSEKEKNTVLNHLKQIDGINNVDNQLKVVMK